MSDIILTGRKTQIKKPIACPMCVVFSECHVFETTYGHRAHNKSRVKRYVPVYYHKLFVECIFRDHAIFINFLFHRTKLLRNSMINWDNPRTCRSRPLCLCHFGLKDLLIPTPWSPTPFHISSPLSCHQVDFEEERQTLFTYMRIV